MPEGLTSSRAISRRSFYRGSSTIRISLILVLMQAFPRYNPIKLFIPETQHVASAQKDSCGLMPMSCPQM